MSEPIITVDGIGKAYRIGLRQERYPTFRSAVVEACKAPFRRIRRLRERTHGDDIIWALKDVSFEVERGEVLGIIGRNGAGKSTLLKILSRITEPTEGTARLRGRVASLLEVGTGFHPELSGRENVYLNGAILGMSKAEIDRKFDEIVAFSGIEKFIDTPVKHYSSGMYVRLAFAVAAHLDPEILLIDEVLSVGDMEFRKRCLGKMHQVAAGEGRTVLFVTHNMGALLNLCPRSVLLVDGEKREDGTTIDVVRKYIQTGTQSSGEAVWDDPNNAPGNGRIRLHAVRIRCDGMVTSDVEVDKDVTVEIEFWNLAPGARISTSIHLLDKLGNGVLASGNFPSASLTHDEWFGTEYPLGLYRTCCILPANFLNTDTYSINAFVLTDVTTVEVRAKEVVSFTVHETGAMRKEYGGGWLGVVRPKLAWRTQRLSPTDIKEGVTQPQ